MDKTRAMLDEGRMKENWWDEAVLHVVVPHNRTVSSDLNEKTPHEILHGSPPKLNHMSSFGCGAYVQIHKETRKTKLGI